jgi:NADH-quinone oxidoreductase subunit E
MTGPGQSTGPHDQFDRYPMIPTTSGSGRDNFRTTVVALERPGDPSVFDEQTRIDAAQIIARYPDGQARSALLPMLHLVQSVQGCITPDGIAFCAEVLDLTKAQVSAVATFYTMYKREPAGDYLVSVCTNTLCAFLGGSEIFAALKDALGVGNNETTEDGTITLEHAECLAACDYAPVVTVNYEYFDNQTVDSALGLVGQLRQGERPMPTRGAPLCTFKQMERQIAGFFDESGLALNANSSGVPTERGVRLAIERGESAPSYAAMSSDSRDAEAAAGRSTSQPTSEHDAPLQTAESDESHPAKSTRRLFRRSSSDDGTNSDTSE